MIPVSVPHVIVTGETKYLGGFMVELNSNNFYEFIKGENCVVQFSAQWCFPCKAMSKTINSCNIQDVNIGKIDIDKDIEIMKKYNIRSVPTTLFFKNGVEISRVLGSRSKKEFISFISNSKLK